MALSKSLAVAAATFLLASPAAAQFSPCPAAADPAVEYDATEGFKLCAPTEDTNGDPLAATDLDTCTVQVDGYLNLTQAAAPGEILQFPPVTGGGPKRTVSRAYCTGPAGQGPNTDDYQTLIRVGPPKKPVVVK